MSNDNQSKGMVFNIQRFSLHDGPGIRTLVFLKGCSLRCSWCCNPESMSSAPELAFAEGSCNKCGKCVLACPEQAIVLGSDGINIDRRRCTFCGRCVEICYPEALIIYGQEMTAEEVFTEVVKDRIYYEGSGGGITLSGGEPLFQPEFTFELLELCHKRRINTCLETSGYGSSQTLVKILPFTDHVLFDLKQMDHKLHHQYTGERNDLVLTNAKLIVESGTSVVWRMPLIPGINNTLENIRATANFIKEMGMECAVQILPYHRLGRTKYQAIGKGYPLDTLMTDTPDMKAWVKDTFEELGVHCSIV